MSDPYADVKAHFETVDEVTVNAGKGSQGLKLGKKMFAMFYKGKLVVRLSPERVAELVASGEGQAFDPGTGRPMPDRVAIPVEQSDDWVAFCEESQLYAESLS